MKKRKGRRRWPALFLCLVCGGLLWWQAARWLPPLQNAAETLLAPLAAGIAAARDYGRTAQESLPVSLSQALAESDESRRLAEENRRLRTLLSLPPLADYALREVTVLGDGGNLWRRQLRIAGGRAQGVREGSWGVNGAGALAGQVTQVWENSSLFTLLWDAQLSVACEVSRLELPLCLTGDLRGGRCTLGCLSAPEQIGVGDRLTTLSLPGQYPPGLPVGRVLTLERGAGDLQAGGTALSLAWESGLSHLYLLEEKT